MLRIRTADRLCRSSLIYRTMAKAPSSITPAGTGDKDIETLIAKKIDPKTLEIQGKFPGMPRHKVTSLDKISLVWSGHYRTLGDVPRTVEYEEIHKSKTYARIRVNIAFLCIGALGCIGMVLLGKYAAKTGFSVESENLRWHREIKEEYMREQEEGKKE